MRCPKKIRIGAHTFAVKRCKENKMDRPSDRELRYERSTGRHFAHYGDCSVSRLLIRLNEDIDKQTWPETLLHEVLHAICELTGATNSFKPGREEQIVQDFGHALTQVLRDNPTLTKMFLGGGMWRNTQKKS